MSSPTSNTGHTQDSGYQFGIRRTVHLSPAAAWDFLLSPTGLRIWLGEIDQLPIGIGNEYQTADGVHGKIRVFKPGSHIRMDWQAAGQKAPSTLQVRVLDSGGNATISIHLERLEDENHRLEMSRQWSEVMEKIILQVQ